MRLPLFALVAAAAGCERVGLPADLGPVAGSVAARYLVRSDLMPVGDLGAPPRWNSAGAPPLRVLKLDAAAPDAEFVA
ncbi:MAG: hypothetical protein U0804_06825 [Gemmataceae bacterium]